MRKNEEKIEFFANLPLFLCVLFLDAGNGWCFTLVMGKYICYITSMCQCAFLMCWGNLEADLICVHGLVIRVLCETESGCAHTFSKLYICFRDDVLNSIMAQPGVL